MRFEQLEKFNEVKEEGPFGVLARKAGHIINKSQYMKAAEYLHKILKRKYQETNGKIRHSLGYYAMMLSRQTGEKLNWRELEQEYLNMYGNKMFENFADGKKKGKSRPGRVKRAGASCKGSVTSLRAKAKKYSGERAKMYHWCANMKSGKKKKKESIEENVTSFTNPNFAVEWDEAKRYPEFVKLGKAKWIELAKTGKPIDVDNALSNKIENTEAGEENRHEFDNLEEPKKERFRKAVEAGTVELPIIARYSDGYLELVAGNTRLTGMMREFGKGKAWIFDVPDEVAVLGEDITQSQLNSLEAKIDKAFGNLGIDVNFTRHFIDRVNDERNKTPISIEELARLFAKEYKRWGKPIAQMGPDKEAVLKDLESDINIPFVMKWDRENNELDMIAKTVMRKKNFQTKDQEFPVENIPATNKPGSIGHNINWAGKNAPDKPKSNISIARRKQPEPQNWWAKMIGKGRQMFGLNDDVDEMTFEDDDAFFEAFGVLGYSIDETDTFEAEYRGRKVKLNKPMQGDVKKFKVYVRDPKTGNVKKVNFGHGGSSVKGKAMRIRKSNPKARKSFRARHNCDNPGPKTKARYWSCRKW
jgi:hypothetical protein